jgi:uncharacterized protein (TIGR02246 family)
MSDAEAAVLAADAAWAQAAASNDVASMLSHYTADAVFVGVSGKVVRGTEALRQLWSGFFGRPGYTLTWHATSVQLMTSGDMAVTLGPWHQSFIEDGEPSRSAGWYLAIWRRQADGGWKVAVDKP